MAVTTAVYGVPIKNLFDGTIAALDWNTNTFNIALLDNGHTPSQDTHDFFDDVEGDELAATGGYTSGGAAIANPTVTYDTATDEIRLDGDDTAWTSASFTAAYGVIYKVIGGASSADPLFALIDFDGDQTVSSGTFTISPAATGYVKADVSTS